LCDNWNMNWTENVPTSGGEYHDDRDFFNAIRRENGHRLIEKMLECGSKAGIRDKMFLGFGNVLGYAIMGDFLPNDDDIDMCILADDIPQEQRHVYLMECKAAGLTENRMHGPELVEDKYVWFSIGNKSVIHDNGVKACNWFWFRHGGFWWHSKGKSWEGRQDLSQHPTAKGIPVDIFDGLTKQVKFGDVKVMVPCRVGTCLDWWYGSWLIRKRESSIIKTVLNMPTNDRKTWWIENK